MRERNKILTMCSVQVLNNSSLDKETSSGTTTASMMKNVTTQQDHNFKLRKHHLDLTTTQTKTQLTNYDIQNTNNVSRKLAKKQTLSVVSWAMVFAVLLFVLANIPIAVVSEKTETIDRRDISSSLHEDSESFDAGLQFQHNNFLHRKKRAKSKNLTFLDLITKLQQQSPSLHRKRRKRSTGEEFITKGKINVGPKLETCPVL